MMDDAAAQIVSKNVPLKKIRHIVTATKETSAEMSIFNCGV
tara:strand:+ start:33556 stop:33678 length:123 start_codon:yes stop_codon:yes gene_type:complete